MGFLEKFEHWTLMYLGLIAMLVAVIALIVYVVAERVIIAHRMKRKKFDRPKIKKIIRRYIAMHQARLIREHEEKMKEQEQKSGTGIFRRKKEPHI